MPTTPSSSGAGTTGWPAPRTSPRRGGRSSCSSARPRRRCGPFRNVCSPPTTPSVSAYSYLVSLCPAQIVDELGLDITLRRRARSRRTRRVGDGGRPRGRRRPRRHGRRARRRCRRVGRPVRDDDRASPSGCSRRSPSRCAAPTRCAASSATTRLDGPRRAPDRRAASRRASPTTRCAGIVLTDALIGTFTHAHDLLGQPLLPVPRHRRRDRPLGRPVGGMGTVSAQLAAAAERRGAELVTGAEVDGGAHRRRVGRR